MLGKKRDSLAKVIYQITSPYPPSEIYGLVSQMRRCTISVVSNIAEGFSRNGRKEKIQFYFVAKASLNELQSQLIVSLDLEFITKEQFDKINDEIVVTGKLILGLIKSMRS